MECVAGVQQLVCLVFATTTTTTKLFLSFSRAFFI